MYRSIINLLITVCLTGCSSCNKNINPTRVEAKDPVRHYYPIRQGDKLNIKYPIINKGKDPLIIEDIQTSCGCIVIKKHDRFMVMPGNTQYIIATYNSELNTGYVAHHIRIFGNIKPNGMLDLRFDVNVVPASSHGDTRDYEDIYLEHKRQSYKQLVDGDKELEEYYIGNLQ